MSETGTITFFDVDRGYGFLQPDVCSSGHDRYGERRDDSIFLHASELKRSGIKTVSPGTRLSFDRVPSKRKTELVAGNIRLIDQADAA